MKNLFSTLCIFTLILSSTAVSLAQALTKEEKIAAKKEMILLISKVEDFGDKKKLTQNNFNEVVEVLKYLLILEDTDPSRTALWALDVSYKNNKNIYTHAIGVFSKEDQKKLRELMNLLEESIKRNGDNG